MTSSTASRSHPATEDRASREKSALTDVGYWIRHQSRRVQLTDNPRPPSWYSLVAPHLPTDRNAYCLEIGVCPGYMLYYLAKKHGYRCTGVDLSPRIFDTADAFLARGIPIDIARTDFLDWHAKRRFDLVFSCGFIEHFRNYREVIEKHWQFVRPGGLLLLTVPTLTPVQSLIRVGTYKHAKWREMRDSHNVDIMNLDALRTEVERLPHAEILDARYYSEMTVWIDESTPGVRPAARWCFPAIRWLEKRMRRRGQSSRWYSPEVMVLARRAANSPEKQDI